MAEQAEWVETWCRTCGTMHEKEEKCPGEILATGPERHGYRLLADTNRGPEVYGTLVAPSGDRWRARILTFPNILWVIPHGGTMKFLGTTPAQAEKKAVAFIRALCRRRGHKMRTEVPSVKSGRVDHEQDSHTAKSSDVQAAQRNLHAIRVRYGLSRPDTDAETDDLSEGGLFIRTDSPLPAGTNIVLHLELDGFGIPLKGLVRWSREQQEEGRTQGMGIELVAPHPRYLHYIRQQRQSKTPEVEESTTYEVEESVDD